MLKLIKALHLMGVVMFFGSILGHIALGAVPGAADDAQTIALLRQVNLSANYILTLPGLALMFITGVILIAKGDTPIAKTRWLMMHVVFGLLITLNAVFVLFPLAQSLLDASAQIVAGQQSLEQFHALHTREIIFGAANVLLCLAALFVATIKPGTPNNNA